ncbi:uncharacterized protein TRIVIDRAFT_63061 [Trichoderma virens Gv29-8]|uniref:Dynamin-type G domain-containing protein n=1 Tax=Hypocrea virens (strain Gv29-8 / FGSC 10586) TaxID=413071 RepID=G9ME01_HYPVG|nr:uncharacterized protein TRIVIDRAFT_63061 [Trichoderma virens Gv29-8]EHK27297.1 hypothetical protein TRIVIDRAFT_63061 [Trichoderma virens Gv29-8]UKZ57757.1 hypothetical protein TrVGV298_011618 [Trichoderma virens]
MADASSSKVIDSIMSSDENPGGRSESADQLRGLGQNQQRILDVIDTLRSATLEEIQLPQLVVVGDQSAGKSSVLDAIPGIPIPKDPDGCTRFATEFRLRRGEARISMGIIPHKNRTVEKREELLKLTHEATDTAQLSTFIKKCQKAIFGGDESGKGNFASRDIMTIEIRGPKMPLLTLVDLPGFIQAPNKKRTVKDIAAINDIALDYMKRERTIILAVVAGSSDYVNQVVLRNFLDYDKGGQRTLGIVTKPDLVDSIALEEKFLKLVKNEDIKLDLGWHVLRNRAPQEKETETNDRNQKEHEFFANGNWGDLPKGTYGVESLVAKLSDLLYSHITDYFPRLLGEIKEELERSEKELHAMGRRVNNESEMLAEEMVRALHRYHPGISARASGGRTPSLRKKYEFVAARCALLVRACNMRTTILRMPDSEGSPSRVNVEDYETKTVQIYLDTYVGQHLPGDYDPLIVYHLFVDYSAKWDSIARNYRDRIQGIVNEFLQQVVNSVWPQRMRTRLWSTLLGKKIEMLQTRAGEELERLLLDRRRCSPIYGPEYLRRLKELQVSSSPDKISPTGEILQRMLVYYETVAELAEEDKHNKTIRDRLELKVSKLKEARDDCMAVAMAKGQNLNQQVEPDIVNIVNLDSKEEDLDKPLQTRHHKHENAEPNGRNGVVNRGKQNRSSPMDADLKKAWDVLSDEENNLAYSNH